MTTMMKPVATERDLAIAEAARQEDLATPAWEPRAVARARGLSDLLTRRPELAGVYPPADVTTDAVRWSA